MSGGGVKRGANDPVVMSGSAEELERGSSEDLDEEDCQG